MSSGGVELSEDDKRKHKEAEKVLRDVSRIPMLESRYFAAYMRATGGLHLLC